MNVGKLIRLSRIFSHPSGNLCSVAMDHFINYGQGLPDGLRHVAQTLAEVVAAQPDAVTIHKGIIASLWPPYAGRTALILQSTLGRWQQGTCEQIASPEDAVRLGADGFAVAAFVRGPAEIENLRHVAECVRQATGFEMPVICHIYPLDKTCQVSFAPEDIAWAVRCAVEMGVDVVKTPFCGDVKAHAQIVADCPVPLVAAGGPKAGSLPEALEMIRCVMRSGARGATIGRNIWGFDQIGSAVRAFKAVIHDGIEPQESLRLAGLATSYA